MITLEIETETHISVCDLLIPKVVIICHVMWVCPHNMTDNKTKDILVKSHDYHLHLFQNETSNDVCL